MKCLTWATIVAALLIIPTYAAADDSASSADTTTPVAPLSLVGSEFAVGATVHGTVQLSGVNLVFNLPDVKLHAKQETEICGFGFLVSRKKGSTFEASARSPAVPIYLRLAKDANRKVDPLQFRIPLGQVANEIATSWPTLVMLSVVNGQCAGFMYVHGKPGDLKPAIGLPNQ